MSKSHYLKKPVLRDGLMDTYCVNYTFNQTDPIIIHSTKKLLCSGERGAKSRYQDIKEARDQLNIWLEMNEVLNDN